MSKTAAQRLGKRVRGGESIALRGAFGDETSFYELEVAAATGNPRPDVHLLVRWCGTQVLKGMTEGTTDALRQAAAQKAFPVVYRSQHKSFGQALKRYAKCVGNGDLPEVSALEPQFGSIELLEGSDDLLEEVVLAFAEIFEAEAPGDLETLRAAWSKTRTSVFATVEPALDKARADAVAAAEQADRERAQAAARNLEQQLIKRQGVHMSIDTSKTPYRDGPKIDEAAMFAKHADAEKLLLMGDALGSWMYHLEEAKPKALTALIIDTYWQTITRTAAVPLGSVCSLINACPNLASAFMIGDFVVSQSITSQSLESLTLLADPFDPKSARRILESPAPVLRQLTLGLRYEYGSKADADIASAINDKALPSLQELTIANADDPVPIFRKVMSSGLLARLEVLHFILEDEEHIDACAEIVFTNPEAFAHLRELGLESENMSASPEVLEQLQKHVPGYTFCGNPFAPTAYNRTAFVPD